LFFGDLSGGSCGLLRRFGFGGRLNIPRCRTKESENDATISGLAGGSFELPNGIRRRHASFLLKNGDLVGILLISLRR